MLSWMATHGVGPAPKFDVELAPRLNVLTGDNGLGKSFLLEVAWWAVTGTWPEEPATPTPNLTPGAGRPDQATIRWVTEGKTGPSSEKRGRYDPTGPVWTRPGHKPPMPGIVLYARVDGSFSVWDPARNYGKELKSRDYSNHDRPDAYHFDRRQVWEGLAAPDGTSLCEGLVRDVVSWQRSAGSSEAMDPQPFRLFEQALRGLSADPAETLEPGPITRVLGGGARDYPTLTAPYGHVPVHLASAGVRRIVAMAYLLIWTWFEHVQASRLLGNEPESRFMLLWDEVETHLHPRWQRTILPALLRVIEGLRDRMSVQVLATTHSPLVLASLEPEFDQDRDALFVFDVREGAVSLTRQPWSKQGDALNWLVSDVFGLRQARSVQAERAIEAAEAFMRGDRAALSADLPDDAAIHEALVDLLPAQDPFWVRWTLQRHGGSGSSGRGRSRSTNRR